MQKGIIMNSLKKDFVKNIIQDVLAEQASYQINLSSESARDVVSNIIMQELLRNFTIMPKAISAVKGGSNA